MTTTSGRALIAIILACISIQSYAQTLAKRDLTRRDIGGGFLAAASLDLAYIQTDNYFYQPKGQALPGSVANSEISATGYLINPSLVVDRDIGSAQLKIGTSLEYSDFELDTPANYQTDNVDGVVSAGVDWVLGTRNRLEFGGEFRRGHDALGMTASALSNEESDKWHQTYFSGQYRFGAKDAALNIEFSGGNRNRRYVSNRSSTELLDFNTDSVGSTLYYNYSPKSALLFDVNYRLTQFDKTATGVPDRESSEYIYRAGIQWKATAKTTGDLRLGYSQKDFTKLSTNKVNKASWLGLVTWTPALRTKFSIFTSQGSQESYLVTAGNNALTIDNEDFGAEWTQKWGSRFTSQLSGRFIKSEFIGAPAPGSTEFTNTREDDIQSYSLTLDYILLKNLSVLGKVVFSERSSTSAINEFDNTTSYIGIRLTP